MRLVIFAYIPFILKCETLHRLVLVRSRRTKGMTVFTYMSLLMERSLFSEHFLLKSFLRYSLTWCLTTNLSYPTAGKMAVSTSMDIDAIINQRNILRLSYCYYIGITSSLLQSVFPVFGWCSLFFSSFSCLP